MKIILSYQTWVNLILELIIANPFLSAKAISEKTSGKISEKVKITNRTIESDWA